MPAHPTDLKEMNELDWEKFEGHLDASLAGLRVDILKWMFVFSVLNVVTLGGLMIALQRIGGN